MGAAEGRRVGSPAGPDATGQRCRSRRRRRGEPDLKTNKTGQKAAVSALDDIHRDTGKAGGHADESSATAVREFTGWDTGSGLKDAHAEWVLQVKNLQGRLVKDQESLKDSHQQFQYVDYGVRSEIAQIDAGPDPRREA